MSADETIFGGGRYDPDEAGFAAMVDCVSTIGDELSAVCGEPRWLGGRTLRGRCVSRQSILEVLMLGKLAKTIAVTAMAAGIGTAQRRWRFRHTLHRRY